MIGKLVELAGSPSVCEKFEVIGGAGHTRSLVPGRASLPSYYIPMQGLRFMEAKLWIRYQGDASGLIRARKAGVKANDPEVTVGLHTMEENVKTALTPVLVASWAGSVMASLALAVAAIGLYGIVSFAVNRRLREVVFAWRSVPAASTWMRTVFAQLPASVGVGLMAGMAGAVGLATLIRSMLYDISPMDPTALLSVAGVLIVVGLLASWVPARRAVRVDPASVLRNE